MDSDYTFHLQSRNNLLKSYFLADGDIDYEIEEYTSSIINLMSKGIYEDNWVDRFFINTSTSLLKDEDAKKRILDLDSFKEAEEKLPLDSEEIRDERKKKGRERIGRTRADGSYQSSREFAFTGHKDYASNHRWSDNQIKGSHNSLSSKTPRVNTDAGLYNLHPFSPEIHPLYKKNPTHGYPEFVEKLRNYYLSSEDDVPLSQKHGEIEMRHNSHHKKKEGGMVLDNKFLGDLTSIGEGHGALEHSLYERSFNNWMQDNSKDTDKLISEGATDKEMRERHFKHSADNWISNNFEEHRDLGAGLEKNILYRDIQNLLEKDNFNNEEDARDYLVDYQQANKYSQGEIDNYNKETYEHGQPVRHSHGLGWLGYNLGLEWLSPKERSKVIEHLMEHGSDGEESHQTNITLDDGVKIPMGRIKRNLIKRAMPEMLWAIGNPDRALPNTSAYVEDDNKDMGEVDSPTRVNYLNSALTGTMKKNILYRDIQNLLEKDNFNNEEDARDYLVDYQQANKYSQGEIDNYNKETYENLEKSLLDKINKRMIEKIRGNDVEYEPEKAGKLAERYRLNHLPLSAREIQGVKKDYEEKVQKALNDGKFYDKNNEFIPTKDMEKIDALLLAKTLKTFSSEKKNAGRRNVFHSRATMKDFEAAYLSEKTSDHPLHPMFTNTGKNPLIEPNEHENLTKLLEHGMTYGDKEKSIRTGMQPFTRIKGPQKEHVGDEEPHFDDTVNGLEGLQSYWSHSFQRGGLSISPETYLDFIHNMTANPENDYRGIPHEESLIGTKNFKNGAIDIHSKMSGLFGMFSQEGLQPNQRFAQSAADVLPIHNASTPTHLISGHSGGQTARNSKNHNITEHSRVPGLSNKIRDGKIKNPKSVLGFGMEDTGFLPNTNHTTRVGGSSGTVYDTNIARNSSAILRDSILRGIGHKPGDKDPSTGRTLLGSPVTMYGLNHLFDGTAPLPNVGDEAGLLEFITRGNIPSEENNQQIEALSDDMGEIIEQLEYATQSDSAGEYSISESERDKLVERYKELEQQKVGIMATMFDESYDPENKSVIDNPNFRLLRHINEKNRDADVIHQIARDHIVPGMKKANPDAFPTDNPSQFLIDTAQAVHDAELFMLHSNHDVHGMSGLSLSHRIKEDDSIHTKLGHSHHKDMAETTRDFGLPLDGNMTADEILEELGLGLSNYEHDTQKTEKGGVMGRPYGGKVLSKDDWNTHNQHLKSINRVIKSNKTHVTTLGNLVAQRDGSPEGVSDHSSMMEHYNDETSIAATRPGGAYYGTGSSPATDKTHPLNHHTRRYHQLLDLAANDELENWGLEYHKLPKNIFGTESGRTQTQSGNIGKPNKEALPNKTKRLMSQLVSYDEGAAPDLDEVSNVGKVQRDEVTHNLVPLNSVRSNEGMNGYTYYSSSAQQIHNGGKMFPASSAMSIDRNGNAKWGIKTQSMPMIPASEEGLKTIHGEEIYSQIQNNANEQGLNTMFMSPTSNLDRVSEASPIPESTNYENIATSFDKISNSSLLKNLPKEMPLLDPYHKVFDYENIEELKGFTGDWVASALEVGDRVKVIRRGTFVEVKSEDGKKVGLADDMRSSIRKLGKKSFTMHGVLNHKGLFMIDLMYYDDTDVTDMDVRERIKLLRSQFDSYENVFVPSPSTLRMTDEDGLEEAIKYLRSENEDCKILLRDAKSTYMKGEEKHPKWILLTKADDDFHIPFSMELDNDVFIINYEHDIVKFDIVDKEPINPRAIIGELSQSDYTLTLTKSLERYWRPAFYDMIKEDEDILPEDREEEVEENSGGLLKPKKNSTLILKPNMLKNIIDVIERSIDALEKGHTPMSGGKGLGIDVGSDISSPRGPTKLTNEATLPDWDMKERPHQDSEKPEIYPNREKKASETKRSEYLNTGI